MARLRPGSSVVGVLLLAGAAGASVLVVPGPGTPLQDAIDAAGPGDTVRVALGTFSEHVTITKPLRLLGVRSTARLLEDTTLVDGGCLPGPVITIASDDVDLSRIAIVGPTSQGVLVQGRRRVRLKGLFVGSNCSGATAPAYDVEQSADVRIVKSMAAVHVTRPDGPAGIRVAAVPAGGRVQLKSNRLFGYEIGVLLQNDEGADVSVAQTRANLNARGIVLEGTSGAFLKHNRLLQNSVSGIALDAASSGNRIYSNRIEGSATDVVDDGTGNCWRGNRFATGTVPACP